MNQITNNKKIAENIGKKKQNISFITNHLLDLSAIRIKKIDGKEKLFAVEHSIRWFLLENKNPPKEKRKNLSKEIQTVLKF